jgi:hypothetical protein
VVFCEFQQNRIIDDATILVGDQNILTLTDLAVRKVPTTKILRKPRCIGTRDLNLTLRTDVTKNGLVHEIPIILYGVAKIARNIHMVVY